MSVRQLKSVTILVTWFSPINGRKCVAVAADAASAQVTALLTAHWANMPDNITAYKMSKRRIR